MPGTFSPEERKIASFLRMVMGPEDEAEVYMIPEYAAVWAKMQEGYV
jgi:hypothetical protein